MVWRTLVEGASPAPLNANDMEYLLYLLYPVLIVLAFPIWKQAYRDAKEAIKAIKNEILTIKKPKK